ncbi:MAG: DUF167 domain-containing protein [Pirellulales bacterium]
MPNETAIKIESSSRGVILSVLAQAGARRNAILGVRQGMLRVAVTAAPEKGKANRAIVDLLSEALDVPKSAIELVSGESSPQKRILILNADAERIRQSLQQ